jgi:hypothetical protein
VCLKNICDGAGGQDESNGTPLDPPLFWLDNIFKFFDADANPGIFLTLESGIRGGKKFGSVINIPDPQYSTLPIPPLCQLINQYPKVR